MKGDRDLWQAGSKEHYVDAALYDHEYRRRRADVNFYRALASEVGTGPILELGCGTGRLLLGLIRDGRHVVGVDQSDAMLAAAQSRLARAGRRAERALLVRADFKQIALRSRFPLVICAFNTLQHVYTRAGLERFFSGVRSALAPGGRFVFDVMNPDLEWLRRAPTKRWARTRFHHPTTGEALVYSTNHVYDRETQINHIRLYYESLDKNVTHEVLLTHRMFFPAELEALLHYNGFQLAERYGDFGFTPLEESSEQQVCVAVPR